MSSLESNACPERGLSKKMLAGLENFGVQIKKSTVSKELDHKTKFSPSIDLG